MNNYAKFLAVNANKNKILQKKYYRNPSSQENGRAFEGEAVNYNYFGTIQEKLINSNLDDNKKDK